MREFLSSGQVGNIELNENNIHKYIKVEYEVTDNLLVLDENNGIFDIKNMKRL